MTRAEAFKLFEKLVPDILTEGSIPFGFYREGRAYSVIHLPTKTVVVDLAHGLQLEKT